MSKDKSKQRSSRRQRPDDRSEATRQPALPLTEQLVEQLRQWATEAASTFEAELYELEAQPYGPWNVRISLDVAGPYVQAQSVTIEQCTQVSRYVEALMDADERVPERYTLEVSSPGIERALRRPEHYIKLIGESIRVHTRQPIEDAYRVDGVLSAFEDNVVTLRVGDEAEAQEIKIPLSQIKKAHVTFDFDQH